jgi:hypothetical protein
MCELRHIALPRIDLLCRFSLDWDPPRMTGSFLRSAGLAHALAPIDRHTRSLQARPASAAFLDSCSSNRKMRVRAWILRAFVEIMLEV